MDLHFRWIYRLGWNRGGNTPARTGNVCRRIYRSNGRFRYPNSVRILERRHQNVRENLRRGFLELRNRHHFLCRQSNPAERNAIGTAALDRNTNSGMGDH